MMSWHAVLTLTLPCLHIDMGDADGKEGHMNQSKLLMKLTELGIDFQTVDHPEVFTVEAMMEHLKDLPPGSAVAKNLFLKDKKKNLYLLSTVHDKAVKLNEIAKAVSAPGGLRFADESVLEEKLGVKQGCVTAFALINDLDGQVSFIVDEDLVDDKKYERVYFHPLSNAVSTGISPKNFVRFLESTKHSHACVKLTSDS